MPKHKPKHSQVMPTEEPLAPPVAPAPASPIAPSPRPSAQLSLSDIRARALRARDDAAHTIAELEAWADEIASTIAFLKVHRR